MNTRVKVWLCLCLTTSWAAPTPELELDLIDLAAISRMTPQQLEILAEGIAAQEIMRTKRSSIHALTSAVSKASSGAGLSSKLGLLGQASAGAVSFVASSSSKSGSHDDHHGYSYEPHESKVDFWGLKKSILYTLLQAAKAITGGVTILKGQLIKGGGHLATTVGKVIAVKGEAVSNLGKKIVSSAALSTKKPEHPVYGPPDHGHLDYAPSAYGAPTAPAHYAHGAPTAPAHYAHGAPTAPAHYAHGAPTGPAYSAPSAPSGYGHKYPSHLDGRGKLNGVHAGLMILAPLEEAGASESHHAPVNSGHTPLDPPPSLLHTAFSAIKNVISSVAPALGTAPETETYQPPPPYKPMSWGALNSYGEPAMTEAYPDYDPRNPYPRFDSANSKKSHTPHRVPSLLQPGLTLEKIKKIKHNLNKVMSYVNGNQRSSEEQPTMTSLDVYREMLMKGQIPLVPTPVVTDNEIGVLPANDIPSDPSTTTTTTTTTEQPKTSQSEPNRRKKDMKYILRGNRIVQV